MSFTQHAASQQNNPTLKLKVYSNCNGLQYKRQYFVVPEDYVPHNRLKAQNELRITLRNSIHQFFQLIMWLKAKTLRGTRRC